MGTFMPNVLFILENEKEGLAISNLIDFELAVVVIMELALELHPIPKPVKAPKEE